MKKKVLKNGVKNQVPLGQDHSGFWKAVATSQIHNTAVRLKGKKVLALRYLLLTTSGLITITKGDKGV